MVPTFLLIFLASLSTRRLCVANVFQANNLCPRDFNDGFVETFANASEFATHWKAMSGLVNENSTFDRENIQVEKGKLNLLSGPSSKTLGYSLARLNSREALNFLYGSVEWRVKFQPVNGLVYWLRLEHSTCGQGDHQTSCPEPLPSTGFQLNFPKGRVHAQVWAQRGPNDVRVTRLHNRLALDLIHNASINAFHAYKITWSEASIAWYIDNFEVVRVVNPSEISRAPAYISISTSDEQPEWGSGSSVRMEITSIRLCRARPPGEAWTTVKSHASKDTELTHASLEVQIPLGITAAVIFIFLILLVAHLIRAKRRRNLTGTMLKLRVGKAHTDSNAYFANDYKPPEKEEDLIAQYMQLLDVPLEALEISKTVLGKGNFGTVHLGVARHLPTSSKGPITVAVKQVLDGNDEQQLQLFRAEIALMARLGRHVNVVSLLGVVQKADQQCLLLEYCEFGSLRKHLKLHRFSRHIGRGSDAAHSSARNGNDSGGFPLLSLDDLIKFSYQVCRGMEYLCTRRVIHRDLATRNVLVARNQTLKISDFGLAKQGNDTYTMIDLTVKLPVFWMAPEAIITRTFNQKSDVWSFGVLLWEIFTMGETPFDLSDWPLFSVTAFAAWLSQGNQLYRPAAAPEPIFDMMRRTWNVDPALRPSFSELRQDLDQLICSAGERNSYLSLEEPEEEFNVLYKHILDGLQAIDDK